MGKTSVRHLVYCTKTYSDKVLLYESFKTTVQSDAQSSVCRSIQGRIILRLTTIIDSGFCEQDFRGKHLGSRLSSRAEDFCRTVSEQYNIRNCTAYYTRDHRAFQDSYNILYYYIIHMKTLCTRQYAIPSGHTREKRILDSWRAALCTLNERIYAK